ncbi:unnamed protein product [Linum tenue]|uniref:Condensation domain-containing protein n=1 Tax=Linum tenue TaxID=586396 RepID=A0AAV0I4Y0_9ROSI|nr:unnamed protein product [Linum tenue]
MEGRAECGGGRALGGTEQSWSRAVPGGTGTAVLAILTTNPPDSASLNAALHKLQTSHPILRSRLHHHHHHNNSTRTPAAAAVSIAPAAAPFVRVKQFNLSSTLNILTAADSSSPPLQLILEHELNNNQWASSTTTAKSENNNIEDLFFATTYALPKDKWAVVLRLHVAACDRTTAVSLLNELLALLVAAGEAEEKKYWPPGEEGKEVGAAIEELIPKGKAKKSVWARGVDMVGYSVGSFRLTNLRFVDARSDRRSQVVRFQLDRDQTEKLLAGCERVGIRLCGVLTAAGMIAAQYSLRKKNLSSNRRGGGGVEKQRKYGVVTLTDCRSILSPSLSPHHFGFYHSAIMNTHTLKPTPSSVGGNSTETAPYHLWEEAQKAYKAFRSYKESDRQFTDMADINFLMTTALDNPSLTPSSALRTSLLSVFEDTVVDDNSGGGAARDVVGVEDYMGCASVHGIGPSLAVFDTIREGKLDCVCVYPSPLHSREQMVEFVDKMKSVLVSC